MKNLININKTQTLSLFRSFYLGSILSVSISLGLCNSSIAATISNAQPYCGYPIETNAPNYSAFYHLQTNISRQNIVFFDTILNQQNLTATDHQLIDQFNRFPPYMIRRSSSKYLCDALVDGAVSANGSNTPTIEKSLQLFFFVFL